MARVLVVRSSGRRGQRRRRHESVLTCRRATVGRGYRICNRVRDRKGALDNFQGTDVEVLPANGTDAAVLQTRELGLSERFGLSPVVLSSVLEPNLAAG